MTQRPDCKNRLNKKFNFMLLPLPTIWILWASMSTMDVTHILIHSQFCRILHNLIFELSRSTVFRSFILLFKKMSILLAPFIFLAGSFRYTIVTQCGIFKQKIQIIMLCNFKFWNKTHTTVVLHKKFRLVEVFAKTCTTKSVNWSIWYAKISIKSETANI